jgi:hypothetical protein
LRCLGEDEEPLAFEGLLLYACFLDYNDAGVQFPAPVHLWLLGSVEAVGLGGTVGDQHQFGAATSELV